MTSNLSMKLAQSIYSQSSSINGVLEKIDCDLAQMEANIGMYRSTIWDLRECLAEQKTLMQKVIRDSQV